MCSLNTMYLAPQMSPDFAEVNNIFKVLDFVPDM